MLSVIKEDIDKTQELIDTLDVKINALMILYAESIAKLNEIPGVGDQTAKDLIAEIGTEK
jgi:5'-3' exonuclease